MLHTVVIGYGNPLRGDDQIGWFVAEHFRDELPGHLSDEVEIIVCHQLTPELTDILSRAWQVIFIDACEGDCPGTIIERLLIAVPSEGNSFTHNLDPKALLDMTKALYGRTPTRARLLTIVAESFDYTEVLSPPVAAAIPLIVEHLLSLVFGAGCSCRTPVIDRRHRGILHEDIS